MHPLLDLSPERRADALLESGLLAAQAAQFRDVAGPFLARLEPDVRLFGEYLIEELARLSARIEALDQRQQADALSRAERLRIDPLPHIPAARRQAALGAETPPEAAPVMLDAAAPEFLGFGWYPAEPTDSGSLRWSGLARCATLGLPGLGGGQVRVTLALRAPFGAALDLTAQDCFLDGMKLDLEPLSQDGPLGVFQARAMLPDLPAGARVTLLLHGAHFADPAEGPRRETRLLGLGLAWVRIERA